MLFAIQSPGIATRRVKCALLLALSLSIPGFPFPTRLAAQTVTQVSAGVYHTLFLKSDGSLWGMGDNEYGQLGQGLALSQTNLPIEIGTNVSAIAAGNYHSLFVESNESLWAMGYNLYGQLGDGTTNNHYVPEQIVSSEVTGVAAGGFHSLFTSITPRRPLPDLFNFWVMGDNSFGQLGDGTTTSRDTPEEIISTDIIVDLVRIMAGGGLHTLFARDDGSLWTAGDDQMGQLGGGTNSFSDTFLEIFTASNVVAVAAGQFHSLFVESDGSLWAMGDDSQGELGDGSTVDKFIPEQVATNVTAIAAGYDYSLFIKSDGSLWGMGEGTSGQLGTGTIMNPSLPVMIVASNVVAVAAGYSHSLFIKSDGSLWAMGDNYNGDLGDGTVFSRFIPVQVVPLVIPQPAITNISVANTNLVLSGTNGESGRNFITFMSTNLALPLSQWTPAATNFIRTDGAFTITATNAVNPNAAQAFYILQAQAENN